MKTLSWRGSASNGIVLFVAASLLLVVPATAFASDIWNRFWSHLIERPEGPMSFRFILQPIMAVLAAYHDGVKDAATGRSPYFWTVLTNPEQRRGRLREGLRATGKIMAIGLAMDLVYQAVVFKRFYPMEAVAIALLLAFVPYLLLRGPVARMAARRRARQAGEERKTP